MRSLCMAVGVAVAFAGVMGCGSGKGEKQTTTANQQDVLKMGTGAEPQDLDPHVATGVTEHRILMALFEGLVSQDLTTQQPIPGMAESWTISDDKMVYTFKIRPEAKWSNGDPLTAQDFVYSYQRILSAKFGAEYADMLYYLRNAREYHDGKITDFSQVGVKAVDDRTLEISLVNPTPYFLSMQIHNSWFPVHKATIEKFDAREKRGTAWTRAGNLVSNGPYRLETWEQNKVIRVVKNEHYWGVDKLRLNAIEFYPIDSELTEEHSFRSGELHLTSTAPVSKIEVYKKEHPELIHINPYFGSYFYRFNLTKKPFDDVRVRKAFALAIDRESIVKNVIKGEQAPAGSFVPPYTLPGTDTKYVCPVSLGMNVEEARKLLAEAGYPNGQGLPHMEILINTLESHKQIAEAIQNMWKVNLNADVTIANQDWKVYLASMSKLDYQIARSSWIGDYHDPFTFLDCFVTDRGNNRTGFSSAEYDALLEQSKSVKDPAERLKILEKAEGILINESPIMPIYFYTRIYLQAPELKGLPANPLGTVDFKTLFFQR